MKKHEILVLGGKGKTGRKVVQKLTNLGQAVRVGSRNENPAFDWNTPTTWPGVLEGINTVYITYQPDLAVPAALKSIQDFTSAAIKSGVDRMVLLSGRGEKEAQLCEQIVMNAGVKWTIVRADWFNQNFSESFFLDPILAGHLALPQGETLVPFVDTDDISDVVVEALLKDEHIGQIYELTGPRLINFKQVVAEISAATGRNIQFQPISMEAYKAMLEQFQLPADYVWLIEYLFSNVLDGRNSSITHDIEKVLGRKPKGFNQYVIETVKTGVWNTAD